ncbi:hypothetical protein X989_3344 [Burkholderia pseudomallei MSHR4378]|nr:hypothetical protein X989_3344 [Burkholderia pseudomallei MSHR4378]
MPLLVVDARCDEADVRMSVEKIDCGHERILVQVDIRVQNQVVAARDSLDGMVVAASVTHITVAVNDGAINAASKHLVKRRQRSRRATVVDKIEGRPRARPAAVELLERDEQTGKRACQLSHVRPIDDDRHSQKFRFGMRHPQTTL